MKMCVVCSSQTPYCNPEKRQTMRKSRILTVACVATALLCSSAFAAPKITITAPTITFTTTNSAEQPLVNTLNSQMKTQLETVRGNFETSVKDKLKDYGDQSQLAQGFGNANAYSAQSATLQGYQGYKLFSVMGGGMIGAQLPSFDPAVLQKIPDEIKNKPDLYAGISPSIAFLNVGINAESVFGFINKDLGKKLNNFYFNVKFGTLNTNYEFDKNTKLAMKSTNFGVGVNYQFIPSFPSIMFGLFKWRGITFGSGLNVQTNDVTLSMTLSEMTQNLDFPISDGSNTATFKGTMSATPKIDIGVNMTTFSIPLEATTSAQLLWLSNVNFGVGADLVFGSSDVNVIATSDVSIKNLTTQFTVPTSITGSVVPGSLKLDASTTGVSPQLVRARIMAGYGLNLGPVKIDIPVYYYLASGFAFGISAGFVW